MLMEAGTTFTTTLLTLYNFFLYVTKRSENFRGILVLQIGWTIYCLITLISIIYVSNMLKDEV